MVLQSGTKFIKFNCMIIQLNPSLLVNTPLGKGHALFILDYGMHQNSCWIVALQETGIVKHFDCNDVILSENYTYQINVEHKFHP